MLRFYNRSSVRITGKTISNEGVGIFELKQGKVIKSQVQTDRLGFLQEMEALPLDLNLLPIKKTTRTSAV